MKKEIYRFLSHVTFGGLAIRYRNCYKKLKNTKQISKFCTNIENSGNNIINVPDGKNIQIKIVGENNVININSQISDSIRIRLEIFGDGNVVSLGKIKGKDFHIQLGYADGRFIHNSKMSCGDNSLINGCGILMIEDDTHVVIGNDCLFSYGIKFRCTDDHTILNANNEVINKAQSIEIGNRVWIGMNATILKNSVILNDSIVGYGSVVAKKFDKSNVVIVGNPARIVKEGITWNNSRPDLYK